MEMIRKIMVGASISSGSLLRPFFRNYRLEIKLLGLASVGALLTASFGPRYLTIQDLAVINAFKHYSQTETLLKPSERIDMERLISRSMSYSYEKTQLGFYLKNLAFFDTHTKAQAEELILANLPLFLKEKAKNYVRAVLIIAEKHQVDPIWVLSVMWTESHFDYSAKSWAGARGLMQIMPETRKFVYRDYRRKGNKLLVEQADFKITPFFPYNITQKTKKQHIRKLVNIELGVIYLKKLLRRFKDHKHATVAYNMGPGWTQMRLRKNLPVGNKNEYLDKVDSAYKQIIKKI